MSFFFRLFLAFNSTSLLLVVYWIKMGITFQFVPPCIFQLPNYVSYCFYILLMIALTYISLLFAEYLDKDNIQQGSVKNVEYANDAFLPSYLGYFFVALDVPNTETLYYVYALIFVFTFLSQTLYFNPIFLLFGYHFYNLTTANDSRIFMITKQKFRDKEGLSFPVLARINDFTYIEMENKKS